MSYTQYTSPPGGPPTSTTYPYGAYPYQPTAYQTGVTSYGWPYPYSYVSHLPQPVHAQRPGTQTPGSITAHTHSPSVPPTTAPPRPSTFTSYARESAAAAGPGGVGGRGSRKQSTVKGLFTKELKSLMYGFGDDRNPATDSVNVMEEILVEYITDVCQTAGSSSRKTRLSIEDLRKALSRPADAKKLARMEELLFMQEDIKRARAQFLEPDTRNPNDY